MHLIIKYSVWTEGAKAHATTKTLANASRIHLNATQMQQLFRSYLALLQINGWSVDDISGEGCNEYILSNMSGECSRLGIYWIG